MATPKTRTAYFWRVSVLFFMSGGIGLAYQVVWFKHYSHAWGNSTLAMAAVVTSFLAGLGIGAPLLGRWADRIQSPLLWYGVCEVVIAALAFVVPLEIHWLANSFARFSSGFYSNPALGSMAKFALTFIVLGPPCILMGGTLPLIVKHFTPPGSTLQKSTGWLYALNTLGAAVGCWAAGFHLLPWLGLDGLNLSLVALGALVGVGAIIVGRMADAAPVFPLTTVSALRLRPAPALPVLYVVAAATGCASLVLEVVWTRQLALILGGSTYAFTAMLTVFLLGIGLGSLVFHWWIARSARDVEWALAVITTLIVTTAAGKLLIPLTTETVGMVLPLRTSLLTNGGVCLAASAVLELLPTFCMGILFPLLISLTRQQSETAGTAVGNVYALNILGSILGAACTALVLIPLLGTAMTVAVALGIYTGALVLLFPPPRHRGTATALFVLCILASGGTILSGQRHDPLVTNVGLYLYGYEPPEYPKIEFFQEGHACNVLVTSQGGHVALRVNGKVDASNSGDMSMQLGLAYFPLLVRPQAKNTVVIGYGSGTTTGAALLFPYTEVTCCEIEPAVLAADTAFHSVNHNPQASPRFRAVLDDGRNFLQSTDQSFDVILSEPSNPWLAGVASLYTKEFYTAVKKRLNPGGILAQWIQTYHFPPEDYALVTRTLLDVLPYGRLVRVSESDTILMASNEPLVWNKETLDISQAIVDQTEAIYLDFEEYFGTTDVRELLLGHVLVDTEGLNSIAANGKGLNTDLNLRVEFTAPLRLFDGTDVQDRITPFLYAATEPSWLRQSYEQLGANKQHVSVFHDLATRYQQVGLASRALEVIELGLEFDPNHARLLADRLILTADEKGVELAEEVNALLALSLSEANRVGIALHQEGKHERAAVIFQIVAARVPNSASIWTNVAINYDAMQMQEEAQKARGKAIALDPLTNFAQQVRELGKLDE